MKIPYGPSNCERPSRTYGSLGRVFYPLSEKGLAQGYCDLFLGASRAGKRRTERS